MIKDGLRFLRGMAYALFIFCLWQQSWAQQPPTQGSSCSKEEYDALEKKYEAVLADRDNIVIQTKALMDQKSQCQDTEAVAKAAEAGKKVLQDQLTARLEQISLLQQKIAELQQAQAQAAVETDSAKNTLEKLQVEYKVIPETKKEITRLQKENADVTRELKTVQAKMSSLQEQKLDAYAQAETYRRQVIDFRKRTDAALAKNRALEKRIAAIPSKFAEMARENKVLIKETALMHYNLGVFYTQSKEYLRSIAEFEKAIELNPDDPYVYYNLGYIYAEYMVNRPKAIDYFRRFLKIAKSEDKDLDWVKKYILTWQTWEGKKPME